jgi:hypothetical protein
MLSDNLSKLDIAALVGPALEVQASYSGPFLVSLQIEEEEACSTAKSSTIERKRMLRERFMTARLLWIQ